jgi:hypothetical protein
MPQKYVVPQEFQGHSPAIAAGKTGAPESIVGLVASVAGVDTLTFSNTNLADGDSISVNGLSFAAVVAGAVGNQFNIGASLTATLAAAVIAAQATLPAASTGLTFSSTATTFVSTSAIANNFKNAVLAAVRAVGTAVYTVTTAGVGLTAVSLTTEYTNLNTAAVSGSVFLDNGDEGQRKSITSFGTGTVVIKTAVGKIYGIAPIAALGTVGAKTAYSNASFAPGFNTLSLLYAGGFWNIVMNNLATLS